jgi:hypothetical protein
MGISPRRYTEIGLFQLEPLRHGWRGVAAAPGCAVRAHARRGKPVQIDPIESTLKAPENKRLKQKNEELLSDIGFKFNLRCYTKEEDREMVAVDSWQGLTLVHVSAQPEPFLMHKTP